MYHILILVTLLSGNSRIDNLKQIAAGDTVSIAQESAVEDNQDFSSVSADSKDSIDKTLRDIGNEKKQEKEALMKLAKADIESLNDVSDEAVEFGSSEKNNNTELNQNNSPNDDSQGFSTVNNEKNLVATEEANDAEKEDVAVKDDEVKLGLVDDVKILADKADKEVSEEKALETTKEEEQQPVEVVKKSEELEVDSLVKATDPNQSEVENKAVIAVESNSFESDSDVKIDDSVKIAKEDEEKKVDDNEEGRKKARNREISKEDESLRRKRFVEGVEEDKRLAKLNKLREKYLVEFVSSDFTEGDFLEARLNRERSVIVPRKKVKSKFIYTKVPETLLVRVQNNDNKHHPIYLTHAEKIDLMFKSIAMGDIRQFEALLDIVKEPNVRNKYGDTLLTFAVLMRKYGAISSLISRGANPNLTNSLMYTPLNIAIESADYKATSLLIDMGANYNFVDNLDRTYLMGAARVGSLPIVDLLLSKGLDINAQSSNKLTAIGIAYRHKKNIIVKYLLKHGAREWIEKDFTIYRTPIIEELEGRWK